MIYNKAINWTFSDSLPVLSVEGIGKATSLMLPGTFTEALETFESSVLKNPDDGK